MIRVAQLFVENGYGGIEACILNYYRHIDRTQVQFDFFVDREDGLLKREEIEKLGGRVIVVPSYRHLFSYVSTLKEIFKRERYDIVHVNMNALSVFALYAAKKAGIGVRIAHSHSTSSPRERKKTFLKNLLRPFSKRYATHRFACSVRSGCWLFGERSFRLIPNAVELDAFSFREDKRKEVRERLGLSDAFVVGHVGRFAPQKNHAFLIDVFSELQKRKSNAVLLLLGDGQEREAMEEKIEKLFLSDRVLFLGNKENAADYYSAMDVFVLPSLYEGLPVVGIEAQANGLPCFFADTITKEAKLTKGVSFFPLEKGSAYWAEEILKHSKREMDVTLDDAYDIEQQANHLLEAYLLAFGVH
ncbi:MAG: glycosyltransferase family 1 protein [Clostridia bacterium]|nr:glycosyltransferase family 1 protein [Clostridia bacterium]